MSAATLTQLRAGALRGHTRLDLSAELTTVPPEILALADSLEILNLSHNRLTDLPDWLPELKKLRILFCSNNPFRDLPEVLGRCPALEMAGFKSCQIETLSPAALPPCLRWLILTDNCLTELPPELGARARLQKLMLSGNRLTVLPPELAQCRNLELLRLASNQFTSFPEWLWKLPSLAWLAVAGNPATAAALGGVPEISWQDLELTRLLGEGASGLIHRARWRNGAAAEVAVKLFKGNMTSDGSPDSEMAASLAVGAHPHLIGALGKLTDHPDGTAGLVMPLIPSVCQVLAGPPSLESCTRDVYPEGRTFTAAGALRLVESLAEAAAHLHGRRLLHGDLYAHNVLFQPDGVAWLGDFGAASFYPAGPADLMERLEVRAFGLLLHEIATRINGGEPPGRELTSLADRCVQPAVGQRPGFGEISATLRHVRISSQTRCPD